jgi:hypothetical protein
MLAAILGALQAIPALVNAVRDLTSAFQKYQDAQWRNELNEIASKLNSPTTVEEKQDAAKKLSALIARL